MTKSNFFLVLQDNASFISATPPNSTITLEFTSAKSISATEAQALYEQTIQEEERSLSNVEEEEFDEDYMEDDEEDYEENEPEEPEDVKPKLPLITSDEPIEIISSDDDEDDENGSEGKLILFRVFE